jgi:hypothetical protein
MSKSFSDKFNIFLVKQTVFAIVTVNKSVFMSSYFRGDLKWQAVAAFVFVCFVSRDLLVARKIYFEKTKVSVRFKLFFHQNKMFNQYKCEI